MAHKSPAFSWNLKFLKLGKNYYQIEIKIHSNISVCTHAWQNQNLKRFISRDIKYKTIGFWETKGNYHPHLEGTWERERENENFK